MRDCTAILCLLGVTWACADAGDAPGGPAPMVRDRGVSPVDAFGSFDSADAGTPDADAPAAPDASVGDPDASPAPDGGDAPDADRPRQGDGGLVCGDFSAEADGSVRPVDIVWIVDASPSMDEEIAIIEANLNAWAARIASSGLDYRVVLIGADRAHCTDGRCYFEICVPEPLSGAAGCPDSDSARYRHVRAPVHSGDGLDVAVATLDAWGDFLRPEAALHFVMVTDDDQGWGLDADEFSALLDDARFGDPVRFHSVIDEVGRLPSCGLFGEPECSCGEARGETYVQLSERTGGRVHSVCAADWDPIFAALEDAVVAEAGIPCAFDLPALPDGLGFATDRVNVDLRHGAEVEALANVADAAACGAQAGWYYDDPEAPARVHLCPAACESGADAVEIEFGCEIRKR